LTKQDCIQLAKTIWRLFACYACTFSLWRFQFYSFRWRHIFILDGFAKNNFIGIHL